MSHRLIMQEKPLDFDLLFGINAINALGGVCSHEVPRETVHLCVDRADFCVKFYENMGCHLDFKVPGVKLTEERIQV